MKRFLSLALCFALIICTCSCALADDKRSFSFFAMDTLMQVTLYGADADTAESFKKAVTDRTAALDALWGVNSESGDIAAVNAANGAPVEISPETAALINKSVDMHSLTGGAFDITLYPVLKLWGFTDGLYRLPEKSETDAALGMTGAEKIIIDGNTLTLPAGFGISLGGIAKGSLGDEMIALADKNGINAVFSLGGNVAVAGSKKDGSKWKIGIADPENTAQTFCTVEVDGGCSVVTSGAYERYFEQNGKKYHHIIDPQTGAPAQSDIISVTVIGKDGAECDALSTAFFVMGYEKAAGLQKKLNGIEYVILTSDKTAHVSSAALCAEAAETSTYSLTVDN